MPKVELASPFHDPEKRLLPIIDMAGSNLVELYDGQAAVSLSPTTDWARAKLAQIGFVTDIQDETVKSVGNNYRLAIDLALKSPATHIHLLDFDRALHWAGTYPDELKDIINRIPSYSGLLSFGRTQRAYETHPFIQQTTESSVNDVASRFAGKEVDIMSGSFAFDRELAYKIFTQSRRPDSGFYSEILKIAVQNNADVNHIVVEGLEWETPDQYKEEIREIGYTRWVRDFEVSQWQSRMKMMTDATEVLS